MLDWRMARFCCPSSSSFSELLPWSVGSHGGFVRLPMESTPTSDRPSQTDRTRFGHELWNLDSLGTVAGGVGPTQELSGPRSQRQLRRLRSEAFQGSSEKTFPQSGCVPSRSVNR